MSKPLLRTLRPGISSTRHVTLSARLASMRHASAGPKSEPSLARRVLSTTLFLGGGIAFLAYYYDSRSILHEHIIMPVMRLVDPETGHKLAVKMLGSSSWLRPKDGGVDGEKLQAELFGMKLSNPVGMAAGFDKDAEAIDGLFDLGFGYVEVGSVTPVPQPGNPLPRFFRLTEDSAAINRYGFNSLGHPQTLARLRERVLNLVQTNPELFPFPIPIDPLPPSSLPRSLRPGHILAVNLGKNKTSAPDSNEDYIHGVRALGPYADVVVINVSSPNTPGLRALQGRAILEKLLKEVVSERDRIKVDGLPKIAVKVACDLTEEELGDVASAVKSSGVEGVIVSNTTIRRDGLGLQSANQSQTGGLSGKPLFPYALHALKTLRPLLPPSIPIVGCGGISTGSDALQMAQAGASIVQLYTSFGFRGVGTPRLLKDELEVALGGSSWRSQIGTSYGSDGQMGYVPDEERLKTVNEAVVSEAKGLGQLLRDLKTKEDVTDLMKEAQIALGRMKRDDTSATTSKTGSKAAQVPPRDNALGAGGKPTLGAPVTSTPPPSSASPLSATTSSANSSRPTSSKPRAETPVTHCETERDLAFALIDDTLSPHVVRGSSHTPHHERHTETSSSRPPPRTAEASANKETVEVTRGMTGSGPVTRLLSKVGVLPEPAADLEPIVVMEGKKVYGDKGETLAGVESKNDQFAQEVKRDGGRRLV